MFYSRYISFGVVLLFAAAVASSLLLLKEPLNSDDLTLFSLADSLANGEWFGLRNITTDRIPSHQPYRLGILLPGALFINIFKANYLAYYATSIFFILLTFCMLWIILREFYSSFSVAIFIFMCSLFPPFTDFASVFLGDLPGCTLLLLGLYLLHRSAHTGTVKQEILYLLVGSLLIFGSYLCKLTNIIFAGIGVVGLFYHTHKRWHLIIAALFVAFLVLAENYYYIIQHNMSRYDVVSYQAARWAKTEKFISIYDFLWSRPLRYLHKYGAVSKYIICFSFILHPVVAFNNRKNFIGIFALIGFISIVIYLFGIYDFSGHMIQPYAISQRYFILFSLSSIAVYSWAVYILISLFSKYPIALNIFKTFTICLAIGLCLSFSFISWNDRCLAHPGNSYYRLFLFFNSISDKSLRNEFTYSGDPYGLRGIRLFDSIPFSDIKLTYSRDNSSRYLMISIMRAYASERLKIRFNTNKKNVTKKDIIAKYSSISNFNRIFVSSRFMLFRLNL